MHFRTFTLLLSASAVFSAPLEVDVDSDVDAATVNARTDLPEDHKLASRFSVPVVPNPEFKRDGFHELRKAYLKYKRHFSDLVIPPGLLNYTKPSKLQERGTRTGTVVANPVTYDTMYLSPITIGGQKMNMDFDTGSSDLWVFSNQLSSTLQAKHKNLGGNIYTPSTSAKVASGLTWSITYADSSGASGTVVTDSVKIGGITVAKQAVEVANTITSGFEDFEGDGLLGLAFSSLNQVSPTQQKTWIENAMPQLKAKLFAADLRKSAVGSYTWGFISQKYAKKIKYAKILNSGWWHVAASKGIKVNGKLYTSGASNSKGAVPDTGSTLLLMPTSVVKLYYAQVSGASYRSDMGAWVYPCTSDSSSSMPTISLPVGNNWINVPGKYMTYAYANSAGTMCFGGLQSLGDSSTLPWIYGDIFFKGVYSVFDYGNKRFGVAQKS
ncbi:Type I transmembrane sorting receptor [Orbilia oligospora]|uniref:Type I transmembrane sorting receptor n=1 Tax=Orbilia oligospora TaxID=2813651 RepID=A0A6G1MDD3_ORBOL|nr:Type I transmembrane sorting receptor [Orbilia oligospora]KAF3217137.1 Type I transmembrane sorting receptor [Orbilia oligospora]KAF3222410.1 Type I transmembrane sorting receptor [Orbilia oligospora]KAF3223302.1 Type I transmembrane sorting receptor [Orbilia oligospora]KAF3253531.1 Type I transmembrane sorting receptor [Orbilia oligospora]